MAHCVVCGGKAGFLRSAHPECLQTRPYLEPEVVQEISRKLWAERKMRVPRPRYMMLDGTLYRAADSKPSTPLAKFDSASRTWVPDGEVISLFVAGGDDIVNVSPANLERLGVPE